MLLRVLGLHPGARGLGVDLDADAIAEARSRSGDLTARFEVRDAATLDEDFDAVINVASSHAHGGFPAALVALGRLAPVALYGEGFWRRAPSADFLAALGGATEDELADLDGLRSAMRAAGFEHHGDGDSLEYARRIRERRALPGGTDTLGFGLFVLRR